MFFVVSALVKAVILYTFFFGSMRVTHTEQTDGHTEHLVSYIREFLGNYVIGAIILIP